MKIINKVENPICRKWVGELTRQIVQNLKMESQKVIIEEFDGDRVYLKIDGAEYDIRMWDFNVLSQDERNHSCVAFVTYTLFLIVEDEDEEGCSHGEEVEDSALMIKWKN